MQTAHTPAAIQAQAKLAFKRHLGALARGDEDEARAALTKFQKLTEQERTQRIPSPPHQYEMCLPRHSPGDPR